MSLKPNTLLTECPLIWGRIIDGYVVDESGQGAGRREPALEEIVCGRAIERGCIEGSAGKKVVRPSQRKAMAKSVVASGVMGVSRACQTLAISESAYRYVAKQEPEEMRIAATLMALASQERTWGFGLCFSYVRNVLGQVWNHKRVYRIYCALALNLRIKPKRRLVREKPQPLAAPQAINEVWSMDFMFDQLSDLRGVRLFNVIDDCYREGLALEVDLSLTTQRIIRILDQLIQWRGQPTVLRCDNGPEFTSKLFVAWAKQRGIRIDYIQPGKPQQNAYIERFNRTVRRQDWLAMEQFAQLSLMQDSATDWLWRYNHHRPHTANNGLPPAIKHQQVECHAVSFDQSP
jgi:putative transposase